MPDDKKTPTATAAPDKKAAATGKPDAESKKEAPAAVKADDAKKATGSVKPAAEEKSAPKPEPAKKTADNAKATTPPWEDEPKKPADEKKTEAKGSTVKTEEKKADAKATVKPEGNKKPAEENKSAAKVTAVRSRAQFCAVDVPINGEHINKLHYCKSCHKLLAKSGEYGYSIVDLYDKDNIAVYLIEDGVEYVVRDYAVTIERKTGRQAYSITVNGLLFKE